MLYLPLIIGLSLCFNSLADDDIERIKSLEKNADEFMIAGGNLKDKGRDLLKEKDSIIKNSERFEIVKTGGFRYSDIANEDNCIIDKDSYHNHNSNNCINIYSKKQKLNKKVEVGYARKADCYFFKTGIKDAWNDYEDIIYYVDTERYSSLPSKIKQCFKKWPADLKKGW